MNILICHERFLFRFGADRVLILLGQGLRALGHNVTLMANRFDRDVVASFALRVINCPSDRANYVDLNEFTSKWLEDNWQQLFTTANWPDVIVVGGWPFISAIGFFRRICDHVVFLDQGVVPNKGYSQETTANLNKLRALRKEYLPQSSLVISISRFIAESQSRPEAGDRVPVSCVLNAADHMEMNVWPSEYLAPEPPSQGRLQQIELLKQQGKRVLLCLGRWEPGSYKNSDAAFEVMRNLLTAGVPAFLLVLDTPEKVQIPTDLKDAVSAIGFPNDRELSEIMLQIDLGLSVSLWEGFNLPLAEMQWLGKPALVFNIGAHSEVVIHPWFLCEDVPDMCRKAKSLLANAGPDSSLVDEALRQFRSSFRWERAIAEYAQVINELMNKSPVRRLLMVDVTNAARDPGNPGVIRVTRRLGRELQEKQESLAFVIWDERIQRYVFLTRDEYRTLGQFNGPAVDSNTRMSHSPEQRTYADVLFTSSTAEKWLLLPEVQMERSFIGIRRFAREHRMKLAVVFHDAIPLLRPDLCNPNMGTNHGHYMLGLAECDLVLPNSHFSQKCLEDFWQQSNVIPTAGVITDVLPGEFGGSRRTATVAALCDQRIRILCVSTIEPRKNHRNLIAACLWMAALHPELDWSLMLVGNRYEGAFELAEWVEGITRQEPRIQWLGIVDDATLNRLYAECSFTIYASLLEGFGLPIAESIWHGRPCICFNQGVMAELAEGGGCLTVDVTDPVEFAGAIYQLATDERLRSRLSEEAVKRELKTWSEYVLELTQAMDQQSIEAKDGGRYQGSIRVSSEVNSASRNWQEALYGGCLCDKWQMNDSERMSLAGLLARHKPQCSIKVGTFHAGSLSLISQYSEMVFSIDIDSTIPDRYKFSNVSFLSGSSSVILPNLLSELDKADMAVDFLLIDGDHSAAGVKGDISAVLDYVPRKPLFVLMHDSFNPECRRGMLESGWSGSPYCHWVDLDFVPGRIVETPGPFHGELWGGLAAAYFSPTLRDGELQVNRTSNEMFELLGESRLVAAR